MSIFSERLSYLIKKTGVSRRNLADVLGVTPTSISRYLSDDQSPSIEILNKIAEFFNVPIDFLLSKDEHAYRQTIQSFTNSADKLNAELLNKSFQISRRDYSKLSLDKVISDFSIDELDDLLAYAYFIVFKRNQGKK